MSSESASPYIVRNCHLKNRIWWWTRFYFSPCLFLFSRDLNLRPQTHALSHPTPPPLYFFDGRLLYILGYEYRVDDDRVDQV